MPALAQENQTPPDGNAAPDISEFFAEFTASDEGEWYLDRSLAGFRAYPLVQRALRHMEQGEFDAAVDMLTRARDRAPESAAIPAIQGQLAFERGNMAEAGGFLSQALDLDPDLAQARLYRGLVRRNGGDQTGAQEDLRFALASGRLTSEQAALASTEPTALSGAPLRRRPAAQVRAMPLTPEAATAQRSSRSNQNRASVRAQHAVVNAAPTTRRAQRAAFVPRTPLPPEQVLGDLGYALADERQCFPADPLFEIAFDRSNEARFLIARADCYNTAGAPDLALAAFREALGMGEALSGDERRYITQSIDYLSAEPNDPQANAAAARELASNQAAEDELALAYERVGQARDGEAIRHFEAALAEPTGGRFAAQEDLAYAHLRLRNRDEAAASFRRVIDNRARYDQSTPAAAADLEERIYRARREVEMIERDQYAFASAVYRSSDINTTGIAQNDRNQSQVGAEYGIFPFRGQRNVLHNLALYGRFFESFEPDSFALRDASLQAGIGLRLKPFSFTDLVMRAERMIAIGEDARNAWLVSAAHFWGVGGDWQPTSESWTIANTYIEGAWIIDTPEFTSVSGELFLGRAFPIANRLALIPHAVASLRHSTDEFAENLLGEVGIGLGLRYWYDESTYVAPRGTVDLQLQYRWYVLQETALPLSEDGAFVGRIIISR